MYASDIWYQNKTNNFSWHNSFHQNINHISVFCNYCVKIHSLLKQCCALYSIDSKQCMYFSCCQFDRFCETTYIPCFESSKDRATTKHFLKNEWTLVLLSWCQHDKSIFSIIWPSSSAKHNCFPDFALMSNN